MNESERHRRAMDLFDEACELSPDERATFLERRCGRDHDLLREVESLLDHDRPAGAIAEAIDDGKGAELLATDLAAQAQVEEGADAEVLPDRIHGYRVIRLVSHGGMGSVYEAQQDNPRRRVALKMIRPGLVRGQLLKRFHHEAHVLGQLQHPGIAHVYEAGAADTGHGKQPYFAMEFVDGLPLDKFADQRGLCPRARLELVARVCDAVHYAHECAVIHRDLKPGNILVVTGPAADAGAHFAQPVVCGDSPLCGSHLECAGQPKILDFGVARITEADLQVVTLQTEVGQLVGTLSYMSPEQVAGESGDLDRRSDIYALGVILHELLAGKLPHDIREKTIPEAVRIIRDEESSRLGSINTLYRGDIETIVSKALDKDPARRYPSAAEMAADIRRFLRDQPILARPPSTFYQLRKFARRNKVLVGGVAATLISLVIGLVSTSWLAIRESDARRVSDRALYKASLAAAGAALRENEVATAERHLLASPEELRGWEWQHLASRLDQSMASAQLGAPSPDDRLSATRGIAHAWFSDADRKVHVARRRVGRLNNRLEVDTWATSPSAGIAPLGSWSLDEVGLFAPVAGDNALFVQSQDGQATIRELMQGELRESFACPRVSPKVIIQSRVSKSSAADQWRKLAPILERGAERIVFSADGQRICTAADSTVSVLHAAKTDDSLTLEPHVEGIGAAVFSPDGRYLVTAGNNRQLACYDVDDGGRRVWRQLEAHRDAILAAAIAPGPGALTRRRERSSPIATRSNLEAAGVVSSAGLLATGGQDCVLRLWDARTGQPRGAMVGHKRPILALSFSGGGDRLVSCSGDHVRTWMLEAASDLDVMPGHTSFVRSLAMSPDGGLLASGSRELRIWDVASGRLVFEAPLDEGGRHTTCDYLSFSADGRRLLVQLSEHADGLRLRTALIMDVRTGHTLHTFQANADIIPIAFGPAGRFLLSRGADTRLLDADTYKTVTVLGSPFSQCSFDRDGKRIAIVEAREQRILDLPTGKVLQTWAYSTTRWHALVRNGAILALGTHDGGIGLLDVASGRELGVLHGHTGKVLCLAELIDASRSGRTSGSRLVTGADDRTVRLWDLDTLEEIIVLRGHTDTIREVTVTPDGTTIFSASGDYTVRRWDTQPLRDLLAARADYRRLADTLAPRVNTLLDQLADPAEVADHISADVSLTTRQRQVALQLIPGLSAARPTSAERAGTRNPGR